jgi:hypothetical protein
LIDHKLTELIMMLFNYESFSSWQQVFIAHK